jgi:diguanylate cyclase (GGDEF)-like protein/PAS domain S-box-containing protein
VLITDAGGRVLWANRAFSRLSGYELEQVLGATPRLLKSGSHPPEFYQHLWETIRNGATWCGVITNRRQDGSLYEEEQTITPVRNAAGAISHYIAVKTDVTERLAIESSLQRQLRHLFIMHSVGAIAQQGETPEQILRDTAELLAGLLPATRALAFASRGDVPDGGFIVWTADSNAPTVVQRDESQETIVSRVLALQKAELIEDYGREQELRPWSPGMRSALCTPIKSRNCLHGVLLLESKKERHFDSVDRDLAGTVAIQIANAMETRRLLAELERQALIDPLTELNNRRHSLALGERQWKLAKRHGRPFSVLSVDLDHFKQINDDFGHAVGDQAMAHFASCCRESLRQTDVVGRLGGDEFIILLPESSIEAAAQTADRLRFLLARTPLVTPLAKVSMAVSIGLATLDDQCRDFETLLLRVDQALYAAKDAGRNCSHRWTRERHYRTLSGEFPATTTAARSDRNPKP